MGKRRVEIKRIEDPVQRKVCFCKRRKGLFKKAAEFSRLFGVDVLSIAFSPAGNPYLFSSSPSKTHILLRKARDFTSSQLPNSNTTPSSTSTSQTLTTNPTSTSTSQTLTRNPSSTSTSTSETLTNPQPPSGSDLKKLLSTMDISHIPPNQVPLYIARLKVVRSRLLQRFTQIHNNNNHHANASASSSTGEPQQQQQQQQQQVEYEANEAAATEPMQESHGKSDFVGEDDLQEIQHQQVPLIDNGTFSFSSTTFNSPLFCNSSSTLINQQISPPQQQQQQQQQQVEDEAEEAAATEPVHEFNHFQGNQQSY